MIGILPAAGMATRISGLPKWALPIPGGYLLQKHIHDMQTVGIQTVHIGANDHNHELIRQYAEGGQVYIAQRYATMTETVLSVPNYASRGHDVLFSMPDSYWTALRVHERLCMAMEAGADVAVAVFQARPGQHKRGGMCRIADGKVTEVIDKPDSSDFEWIWGALAWTPKLWGFMIGSDPHVGYALPRALAAGLDVRAVCCEGGYYDCGTIEGYYEALTAVMAKEQEWQSNRLLTSDWLY